MEKTITNEAKGKYNRIVRENIEYLESLDDIKNTFNIKKYTDPDAYIRETVLVDGVDISLALDGYCGINKIIKFSSSDAEIIENYRIIRENQYDNSLRWPTYSMSINQQRGFKYTFDDRIDLLLIDLEIFFDIVSQLGNKTNNIEIIRAIDKDCKLANAYLNMHTYIWLKSFGSFESFIIKNNLQSFVECDNSKCKFTKWTDSEIFDKEYFNELLRRINDK